MSITLYRYEGEQTFRPVNGGPLLVLEDTPPPDPDPDPPPPYDADLGTIGERPPVLVKPSAADTGPRQAPTQTMSGTQALAAVLAAPVEEDGYRYLRRANITGSMGLSQPHHSNIVFEDCIINSPGSRYIIQSFNGSGASQPSGRWPEFRYCEIIGGDSSTVIGGWFRFLRCYLHRGADIFKPGVGGTHGGEIYACYITDTWHMPGGHCDLVQIRSRAAGLLIHWNNWEAFDHPDSPNVSSSGNSNAVLQTGTVTGDIGPVYWYDNWFDGGYFTIRFGSGSSDNPEGYRRIYDFKRNKFGRSSSYGPILGSGPDVDFDTTNVWEDTGLPVT